MAVTPLVQFEESFMKSSLSAIAVAMGLALAYSTASAQSTAATVTATGASVRAAKDRRVLTVRRRSTAVAPGGVTG